MNQAPNITVIRKARFAAAHFLRLPELSDVENLERFGPSSNAFAHGHNYELSVYVRGPVDPSTGMVINLKDLKRILHETIIEPLDFKNLNHQVPFFQDRLTTLENLARYIRERLTPALESLSLTLSALKVLESDDLFIEEDGRPDMRLTRKYDFPASHRLYNPEWDEAENARVFHRCNNPNGHGHNYELEVTVQGVPDPRLGMVVDIYALDQVVQTVLLSRVDHKNLNIDVDFLQGIIPTAENIVWAMWGQLSPHIPAPAKLARLRLIETRNNAAEYEGD